VKMSEGWNEMSRTASSLGVETVTVQEFLNQMGYKPQDRTVPLGAGATARDFPARAETGAPAAAAPRFRPRTPVRSPSASPR
jgi:hypothetical protein